MSDRFLRAVLALYPRAFRRRYGAEMQDLVNDLKAAGERSRLRLVSGLLVSAVAERLRAPRGARLTIATLIAVAAVATTVGLNWSRGGHRSPQAVASAGAHVPRATKSFARLGSGTSSTADAVASPVPVRPGSASPVAASAPPPPPPPMVEGATPPA